MGDLAAPDGDFQLRQAATGQRYRRRFEFMALWRRRVENDGVGRASLPRERNGFLHGVDIKQSGTTRNYDERCRLDRFDDAD
jgi:hypothetical protein